MRRPFLRITWLLTLVHLLLSSPSAHAEDGLVPPMPKDLAQVDVFLLTVGRSAQPEALFGHTILRVTDRASGLDLAFNWGIFDFTDPLFFWRFFRGDLIYKLGVYDMSLLIDFYRNVEHRSMLQQQVLLTNKQKSILMQRLIRNSLPANVDYQYSQLRDNCATRPRDHLDAALGGQLSAAYRDRPTAATFRELMNTNAAAAWWVHMSLDLLTNSTLDQPLTRWDEMFLPSRLQQMLAVLPAYGDDGKPLPGQSLLGNSQWLIDLPGPGEGFDPYLGWLLLFGLPAGALLVYTARTPSEQRKTLALGTAVLAFGLWSAVWGSLFAWNWLFSRYTETPHNALLWLMGPWDWFLVYYGARLLRRRTLPQPGQRLHRLTRAFSAGHLTAVAVAALLWLAGLIQQNILPMLASFGVFAALFYATTWWHAAASRVKVVVATEASAETGPQQRKRKSQHA